MPSYWRGVLQVITKKGRRMFADLTMDKVRGCLLFFTLQQRITETYKGLQRAIVGGRQIAPEYQNFFKVVGVV